MCISHNSKLNLLCNASVHSDKKGIIGKNVKIISKHSGCGFDHLVFRNDKCEDDIKARTTAIKDLTSCIEGHSTIDNFSFDELVMFKNYIACY